MLIGTAKESATYNCEKIFPVGNKNLASTTPRVWDQARTVYEESTSLEAKVLFYILEVASLPSH